MRRNRLFVFCSSRIIWVKVSTVGRMCADIWRTLSDRYFRGRTFNAAFPRWIVTFQWFGFPFGCTWLNSLFLSKLPLKGVNFTLKIKAIVIRNITQASTEAKKRCLVRNYWKSDVVECNGHWNKQKKKYDTCLLSKHEISGVFWDSDLFVKNNIRNREDSISFLTKFNWL